MKVAGEWSIAQSSAVGRLPLETALVLAAASVNYVDLLPQWAATISNGNIRWENLLTTAERQGVQPLLWRFLEQFGAAVVPTPVLAELRAAVQINTLRNLKLTGELAAILELFTAHGIGAIPFKGPTLALLAQGDLAWREIGDLDILVARDNLPQAGALLAGIGYEPEFPLAQTRNQTFLNVSNTLNFRQRQRGVVVDLHWELSPALFPFEVRLDKLQPVAPAGKQMVTLTTETLLLYLCSHGARHCWASLGWIADTAWLLQRHPQLDWDEVCRLARATKSQRMLWLGLVLADDLLNAVVPPEIARLMRADTTAQRLAAQVSAWLLLPQKTARDVLARDWFYCQLQEHLSEKARYLLRLAIIPNVADWLFLPLPPVLAFLYPVVRPIRFFTSTLAISQKRKFSIPDN